MGAKVRLKGMAASWLNHGMLRAEGHRQVRSIGVETLRHLMSMGGE